MDYWKYLKVLHAKTVPFLVVDYDNFYCVYSNDLVSFILFKCSGRDFYNWFDRYKTTSVAIMEPVKDDIFKWIVGSKTVNTVFVSTIVLADVHQAQLVESLRQSARAIEVVELDTLSTEIAKTGYDLTVKATRPLSNEWFRFCAESKIIENVLVGGQPYPLANAPRNGANQPAFTVQTLPIIELPTNAYQAQKLGDAVNQQPADQRPNNQRKPKVKETKQDAKPVAVAQNVILDKPTVNETPALRAQIEQLLQEAANNQKVIADQGKLLTERDRAVVALTINIADYEKLLAEKDRTQATQAKTIYDNKTLLKDYAKLVTEKLAQIEQLIKEKTVQTKVITDKEKLLVDCYKVVVDQNKAISDKEKLLSDYAKLFAEKEAKLASKDKVADSLARCYYIQAECDSQITKKNLAITYMEKTVLMKNEEAVIDYQKIQALNGLLEKKGADVKYLQNEVYGYKTQILYLYNSYGSIQKLYSEKVYLEQQITGNANLISQLRTQVNDLTTKLQKVGKSQPQTTSEMENKIQMMEVKMQHAEEVNRLQADAMKLQVEMNKWKDEAFRLYTEWMNTKDDLVKLKAELVKYNPFGTDSDVTCTRCYNVFLTHDDLKRHYQTCEKIICPLCTTGPFNIYYFAMHMATHIDRSSSMTGSFKLPTQCSKCKLVFPDPQYYLLEHDKICPCNNMVQYFTCKQCYAVMPNDAALQAHMRMHYKDEK